MEGIMEKVKEWERTRSIAIAYDICKYLLENSHEEEGTDD